MWQPDEIRHKLGMIERLTAPELLGWWKFMHESRAPFDGEKAALQLRARQLHVTLPSSSQSGPSE